MTTTQATAATKPRKMLDIKSFDEFINPADDSMKAVVDQTLRFNGVPTVVVGIYRENDDGTAWLREDTVHVVTGRGFVIGVEKFWRQVEEGLLDNRDDFEF